MANKPRNTNKYVVKVRNKTVYGGITNDLDRRENEHQQTWPNSHIKKVGRITTREAALQWEKENGYS